MAAPVEFSWLVPLIVPFIIGLLVGIIIRRTINLFLAITALVIVLVATGYIHITFTDLYEAALLVLPKIFDTGRGVFDALPYSSTTFLIGLALGLWKG